MSYQRTEIPESDIQHQLDICAQLRAHFTAGGRQPLAMVDTYGCQQNEADSEKLRGYLRAMGFDFTQDEFAADVVVMNTCAVREHAETRVFGNVGALTHTKARNPNQIIAVCGCMAQQEHVAEKLKKSYRIVDLVFGPHELWRFPELLRTVCTEHRRVFAIAPADGSVAEGIPQQRDGSVKAWLSIMYGCNNFCTYCIVPYVRGRERSRHPDEIEREARELTMKYLMDRYGAAFRMVENDDWLRLDRIGMRLLGVENLTPVGWLYLKMAVTGLGNPNAKYVMIDEVQDYTAAQLAVLARFFRRAHFMLLGDPNQALRTICMMEIWQFGSSMVMFLAALKNVPADLYEAAEIDGASKVKMFFSITVPQITPIIFFNLIMQTIQALQNFTSAFVITDGGPMKATYVLGMKLYKEGFSYFKMGYASAISWIIFIVIMLITLVLFATSKWWVFYGDES